jgi:hypothetical protein
MFLNCTYTEHHTIDSDHVKNNLFMNTQVHSTCGEIALAFTKKCHMQMWRFHEYCVERTTEVQSTFGTTPLGSTVREAGEWA